MKFKEIMSICKKSKTVILFNQEPAQWMGDGRCLYPVHGMPRLTEDNIPVLFDIPNDKKGEYVITETSVAEEILEDVLDEEVEAVRCTMQIRITGSTYQPFLTKDNVFYIDVEYLKPFKGIDELFFFMRIDKNNNPFLAVKDGFILNGIIYPYRAAANEKYVEQLEDIAIRTKQEYNRDLES